MTTAAERPISIAQSIEADQEPARMRRLRNHLIAERDGADCPLCGREISALSIAMGSYSHDGYDNLAHHDCREADRILESRNAGDDNPIIRHADIPDFLLPEGKEDAVFDVETPRGATACLSGKALGKVAESRRKILRHPIWEITGMTPDAEAMSTLIEAVNRHLREEGLSPLVPKDHRGWERARVMEFLDLARSEFRWAGGCVHSTLWRGAERYWEAVAAEYAAVFG